MKVPKIPDIDMESIRKDIETVLEDTCPDASPVFILFICAWNGYFPPAKIKPFAKAGEYPRETLRQRIYREHHKDFDYYDEIKKGWTENRRIELMETLFSLEIKGPNPRNRPRKMEKWMTVFDLKNYFEYLTGDRQTNSISDSISQIISIIDNSDKGTDSASEMQKRRRWFEGIDGKVRLKMLLRFFRTHEQTIEESLKSGITLYKIIEENNKGKRHQHGVIQLKPMEDKEMVAGIKLEPWTEDDTRKKKDHFFKEGKWVEIPPEGLKAIQTILKED